MPSALLDRTYQRLQVHSNGTLTWMKPLRLQRPPMGHETVSVSVETSAGRQQRLAQYMRYDHLDGGVLLLPPGKGTVVTGKSVQALVNGKLLELAP